MKIRSLQLKNIGVFEDETIAFPENKGNGAEIHILTGQNGTGKTTILQALASSFCNIIENPDDNKSLYSSLIVNTIGVLMKKSKPTNNFNSSIEVVHSDNSKFKANVNSFSFLMNSLSRTCTTPLLFAGFAYSGNRFIRHEENINIKEQEDYDPLENALAFDKEYGKDDYSINQWLANTISKRSFARDEGNEEKAKAFDRNIKFLEKIIKEIIEKSIKFEPVYETGIKIVANVEGKKLDFDLLPDGLRSIISWLGDLIMRMDAIKWENDLDIRDREFILFLDEIEVHLHPYWQRKILPVIQKTFQNAQIFITTHSPFIVNSVDGAWIYELDLDEKGNSKVTKIRESSTADSYQNVIRSIFDINGQYGKPVQDKLDDFYRDRTKIMNGESIDKEAFKENINSLLSLKDRSIEDKIHFELEQIGEEIEL
jgi:predicted ATP-binding protein involved in virulence